MHPGGNERRAKIRELLQSSNISSKDDIQDLFKETIAEFMENGLDAELGYRNKDTDNSRKTLRTSFDDVKVAIPETARVNLSRRC